MGTTVNAGVLTNQLLSAKSNVLWLIGRHYHMAKKIKMEMREMSFQKANVIQQGICSCGTKRTSGNN